MPKVESKQIKLRCGQTWVLELSGEIEPITQAQRESWKPLVFNKLHGEYISVTTSVTKQFTNFKGEIYKRFGVNVVRKLEKNEKADILAEINHTNGLINDRKTTKCCIQDLQGCFIPGATKGNWFNKEAAAEDHMVREIREIDSIHRKNGGIRHVQSLKDRFCVRIAKDIPNTEASKMYSYIFCSAYHPEGHVCNPDLFLDYIGKEDRSLYEVVRGGKPRKHYLDVEWESETEDLTDSKLRLMLDYFQRYLWLESSKEAGSLYITKGSRWKTVKDRTYYKNSYHVVYNDVYFKNQKIHYDYMFAFKAWLSKQEGAKSIAVIANHKSFTKAVYGYAYDKAVYTKNRLMRLPGQSKEAGSTTPFQTYLLPGYSCVTEPSFITCVGVSFNQHIRLRDSKQVASLKEDKTVGLTPEQKEHFNIYGGYAEDERRFIKDMELESFLLTFDKTNITSWRDINAKEVRSVGYELYFKLLTAIILAYDPPQTTLMDWMCHTKDKTALKNYRHAYNHASASQNSDYGACFLGKFGLLAYQNEKVEELYRNANVYTEELPEHLGDEFNAAPVYKNIKELDDCADSNVVEVITGDMGCGKTTAIINRINRLPAGSRVLYIVGRCDLRLELCEKMKQKDRLDPKYTLVDLLDPIPEGKIRVDLAIVNSIGNFDNMVYTMVVIDEYETTIKNPEMESVDEKRCLLTLYRLITPQETKVVIVDAMFTLQGTHFFRYLYTRGNTMVRYIKRLSKYDRPPQMAPKKIVYNKLTRDGLKTDKTIINLKHDLYNITHYLDHCHGRQNNQSFIKNEGFLIRLLHNVTTLKENVVVAVPTKKWGYVIEDLFSGNKNIVVKRIDKDTKKEDKSLDNLSKVNVLVYTSTISAGHSIDIMDHFHSIFLVVAQVGKDGVWYTPCIAESIQMSKRVRNTITDKLYLVIDENNFYYGKKRFNIDEETVMVGDNVPYDLLKNGRKEINKGLARLNKEEYRRYIIKDLFKGYPGSNIMEADFLTRETVLDLCRNAEAALNQTKANEAYHMLWSSLDNPYKYLDKSGLNKHGRIKPKQVSLALAQDEPKYRFDKTPNGKFEITADFAVISTPEPMDVE